jgi:alpha-glucosidase
MHQRRAALNKDRELRARMTVLHFRARDTFACLPMFVPPLAMLFLRPRWLALLSVFLICAALSAGADDRPDPTRIGSPNGQIVVEFQINAQGSPRYSILRDGRRVLDESRLGLVRDDADFSRGLRLKNTSRAKTVTDRYEILTAKRRANTYRATRQVFTLATSTGLQMDIIFQVSDDGVAFRYAFPKGKGGTRRIADEISSFRFLPETRAWLQPMSVAKTGWEKTNPSYEEYYEKDIRVGTPSPTGAGWVYPALFRSGDTWLLVSEGSLSRSDAGTRLKSESPEGEYTVGLPDEREVFTSGASQPASMLPWTLPWRLIVVGDLATVVESTLGIDLATPGPKNVSGIVPGKASWSWPLLGDKQTTYDVQKRFVDYAAEMRWQYCLIDALWDKQIGYDKVAELVTYARSKNVKILVWYNSNGDWNSAPQTPRNLLLTRESRLREFERLKAMGVAGLKIDFFGGDGQSMIAYYIDLMEDAAPYGFLLNFHGATLPRGWQRTYPHLMTAEAIRGLEFITFEQKNADQAPTHAAMLPFTRNVFDPMDFTPVVLDKIRRIERRTTSGFELALSVLFTSGIQHYAEIPEGMAKAPEDVRNFLTTVPSIWDDTKFIDGFPGKFAVLARKGDGRWYVAGINGEDAGKTLMLDSKKLGVKPTTKGTLITDGDGGNLSFRTEVVQPAPDGTIKVALKSHGGFVLVLE